MWLTIAGIVLIAASRTPLAIAAPQMPCTMATSANAIVATTPPKLPVAAAAPSRPREQDEIEPDPDLV